jgi:succinate dehydrogenase hydrophobic anchor subunit
MFFGVALLFYVIIFAIILSFTYYIDMALFASVTVAALVSLIFLLALVPPSRLDKYTDDLIDGREHKETNNLAVGAICLIYILTLLLVIWYVLVTAFHDTVLECY